MKLKIIPKVKKEREKLHKQKSNSSLSGETSPSDLCRLCLRATALHPYHFPLSGRRRDGSSRGCLRSASRHLLIDCLPEVRQLSETPRCETSPHGDNMQTVLIPLHRKTRSSSVQVGSWRLFMDHNRPRVLFSVCCVLQSFLRATLQTKKNRDCRRHISNFGIKILMFCSSYAVLPSS